MTIDKSKISRLKKQARDLKTEIPIVEEEKVEVFNTKSVVAGRQKLKMRPTNVVLDMGRISFIDDLTYHIRKKTGTRISTSEVIRASISCFSKLPQKDQLRHLVD